MSVQLDFLRGVLGILGIGCAHMCGRAAEGVRRGALKISRLYGWIIRALVCLLAIVFRHPIDLMVVGTWTLAAVAFGAGVWAVSHHKPPEDLTHQIFPE